jgi:hypothetical protein
MIISTLMRLSCSSYANPILDMGLVLSEKKGLSLLRRDFNLLGKDSFSK